MSTNTFHLRNGDVLSDEVARRLLANLPLLLREPAMI